MPESWENSIGRSSTVRIGQVHRFCQVPDPCWYNLAPHRQEGKCLSEVVDNSAFRIGDVEELPSFRATRPSAARKGVEKSPEVEHRFTHTKPALRLNCDSDDSNDGDMMILGSSKMLGPRWHRHPACDPCRGIPRNSGTEHPIHTHEHGFGVWVRDLLKLTQNRGLSPYKSTNRCRNVVRRALERDGFRALSGG